MTRLWMSLDCEHANTMQLTKDHMQLTKDHTTTPLVALQFTHTAGSESSQVGLSRAVTRPVAIEPHYLSQP